MQQPVAPVRPDRGFVKTRPDSDDGELPLGRCQARCVANRFRLLRVCDRICEMTIKLAEMLFLATRQQLVVTYYRKDKHDSEICASYREDRRQKEFCAAVLSHN